MNNTSTLIKAIGFSIWASNACAAAMILESKPIAESIKLDGLQESVWDRAKVLNVEVNETPYKPSNGYDGISETQVEVRSVYDAKHIYFLLRYADPTKSLARFPWVKQEDGSWKQMIKKDQTGHDNTYYEDKVALIWNINQRGFAKKGCDKSCHLPEDGLLDGINDTSAGRHYTNPGETLDMWHWKSARTNVVFNMDDQYINSDRSESKSWGRHGDTNTGGGYKNNRNADKTGPAYMNTLSSNEHKYWILDSMQTKFVDTFKPGDVIGGVVAKAYTGSRADITAKGDWKDGYWTLEIKRLLITTGEKANEQDVQFTDLSKSYAFGLTIFDNSQINHLFHKRAIKLKFK